MRAGQPKVLDMVSASTADMAKFFVSRRATQRGTHSAVGRPVWPSVADPRMLPAAAMLAGEHAFSGSGVPDGFRFQIPALQELMPPLDLKTLEVGGVVELIWTAAPAARAYFAAGMAAGAVGTSQPPGSGQGQAASPCAASIRALQEKGKGAAAPSDAAVSAIAPRTFKRPLMRCWQEGRLIYEGSGMTVAASAASVPIELRSHSAVALQIFDLKSGLCLPDHATD